MRERGEEGRGGGGSGSGGPESRLLCALPVRRSVPAKVSGSYSRTVAGLVRDPVEAGVQKKCTAAHWRKLRGELGWGRGVPSQPTLWWRKRCGVASCIH